MQGVVCMAWRGADDHRAAHGDGLLPQLPACNHAVHPLLVTALLTQPDHVQTTWNAHRQDMHCCLGAVLSAAQLCT